MAMPDSHSLPHLQYLRPIGRVKSILSRTKVASGRTLFLGAQKKVISPSGIARIGLHSEFRYQAWGDVIGNIFCDELGAAYIRLFYRVFREAKF